MSRANGLAILPDGKHYWFEYNETIDACCPKLFKDLEERNKNWKEPNWKECECNDTKNHKKVILSTDYGFWHFLFESMICETCMAIVGKLEEEDSF